jgi:hypothetical protein
MNFLKKESGISTMNTFISLEDLDEIERKIEEAFHDLPFFPELIKDKVLKILLSARDEKELDAATIKILLIRFFDVQAIDKGALGKTILYHISNAIRCCLVLLLEKDSKYHSLFWTDRSQLIEQYPSFKDLDGQELSYLLRFRNMLKLALNIIPPRLNKNKLIDVAARLEGSGKQYVTGSGQTAPTARRVKIFEDESGVRPEKRPTPRKRKRMLPFSENLNKIIPGTTTTLGSLTDPSMKAPRPSITTSTRRIQGMKLSEDEVKAYSRVEKPTDEMQRHEKEQMLRERLKKHKSLQFVNPLKYEKQNKSENPNGYQPSQQSGEDGDEYGNEYDDNDNDDGEEEECSEENPSSSTEYEENEETAMDSMQNRKRKERGFKRQSSSTMGFPSLPSLPPMSLQSSMLPFSFNPALFNPTGLYGATNNNSMGNLNANINVNLALLQQQQLIYALSLNNIQSNQQFSAATNFSFYPGFAAHNPFAFNPLLMGQLSMQTAGAGDLEAADILAKLGGH